MGQILLGAMRPDGAGQAVLAEENHGGSMNDKVETGLTLKQMSEIEKTMAVTRDFVNLVADEADVGVALYPGVGEVRFHPQDEHVARRIMGKIQRLDGVAGFRDFTLKVESGTDTDTVWGRVHLKYESLDKSVKRDVMVVVFRYRTLNCRQVEEEVLVPAQPEQVVKRTRWVCE